MLCLELYVMYSRLGFNGFKWVIHLAKYNVPLGITAILNITRIHQFIKSVCHYDPLLKNALKFTG